ncbi:MAG: ATP-binding cassette domain-containing protein, partial [Verrucomicrobiales bacterium]
MIRIKNLSQSYAGKQVLYDLDLDLSAQMTHVLIGASGSGKSTLLRIILGLLPFDRGEVRVDGVKVTSVSQREIVSKIGYVVQEGGLFPHLTASDN